MGLVSLSAAFGWASTLSVDTGYWSIVGQMVLLGAGIGLTSTPATEAIMGVVSPEKAGMGSAVNDATRELGGTLGVAVIGSVALSVYRDHLHTESLPEQLQEPARESVGAALAASDQAAAMLGQLGADVGARLADTARLSFVDGFTTGCVVAGVVTAVAAVLTLIYLPAHPTAPNGPDLNDTSPATTTEKSMAKAADVTE